MCQVGVSNGGRSSSIAVGPSNDSKCVFNEASLTPWCHFGVKVRFFFSLFSGRSHLMFSTLSIVSCRHLQRGRHNFLWNEQDSDPACP